MPPFVALILWIVLLAGLLILDPAREPRTSLALWVPVIWMFIAGSRLPSQWLGGGMGQSAQALVEGNPLDRIIDLILIFLAIGILTSRSFKWRGLFSRNLALMAFLSFALISACWSDFPFVAFKRWFRDLGGYIVILVVLSDPRPEAAVRTVLRRLTYLLVPLSIVLDKYYPDLGRGFDPWTGVGHYQGATTSKNMLGVACLVSGLFLFWDTMTRWHERKQRRTRRILALNAVFLAMTVLLLQTSQSTTSRICLLLGCLVIAATRSKVFRHRPAFLKVLIPASFGLYLILNFGFGLSGSMAQAVGKDPTLTDRTKIWAFLLSMQTNPIVGTGYQSFWLGSRLEQFWNNSGLGHVNEAHNGYLEVYLELGLIGVLLLIGFLVAGYRRICRRLTASHSLAALGLATWLAIVFYNMSEAAFGGGLLYMLFLMSGITLPDRVTSCIKSAAAFDNANAPGGLAKLPLAAAGQRR